MNIIKCDICRRVKKEKNRLKTKWLKGYITGKEFLDFDLCEKCSVKLFVYLKKYLKISKKEMK